MKMPRMQIEVAQGIGAGTGVVLPGFLKTFLDEPVPVISGFLGQLGKYPIVIPVATGIIAFSVAKFTNLVKDSNTKGMLFFYGITSTLSGIMLAIQEIPAFRTPVRAHADVPYTHGPHMAKGWASDISRSPTAKIPTTLPAKEIIA